MITSCRAFHPINEPSPPAAPRSARRAPCVPRSVRASRRPALSGWHRFRSSRHLRWACTLAFRRGLTHAPLSRWHTHEHLVHMPPAPLIGQLSARPTGSTLTHDYSPLALRLISTIFTRSPQGTPGFTLPSINSWLAPVWAAIAKSNHDPNSLANGPKCPDMRGKNRISVAENISLSSAK